MKNPKQLIFLLAANILISASIGLAETKYREVNTSKGKVILGMDREKAFATFGTPASRGEGIWYYNSPSEFFVSFSDKPSILLFPDSAKGSVGIPLEFKVFISLPDTEIREITKEVQLTFDQPSCAKITDPGVIIPKKAGKYSALAIYHEFLSNPLTLEIKEESEGANLKAKEKLVSIDLLPYRSTATPNGLIDFLALGTFFDADLDRYTIRDISQKSAWLMRLPPKLTWDQQEGNRIYFLERGKAAEVAAEYEGMKSYIQRVQVKDQPDPGGTRLKHILVLPEVMVVILNNSLSMRAFGSYYNNNIEELTQNVQWRITNQDILESHKNGYFFARAEGVTEVTASKDGVESLPVKVIVTNKSSSGGGVSAVFGSGQGDGTGTDTLGAIQDNVDKLKKDFLVDRKKITSILVTPKLIEIGLGEESKFSATGIYDDGSSSDVTVLGNWGTLNPAIATVSAGNVSTVSVGQTNAFVEFKGVRSESARIVVGGPRLVSLVLTPESLQIPRDGKAKLKVMGNYYDKSQRDLTESATWNTSGGKPCISIDKGVVKPLRFGRSEVAAEYSLLKSNPSSIKVILTLGWLLWLLAKILLVLLLILLGVFIGLYLSADNKRRRLCTLKDDPRRLILELHENATGLVTVFGLRYDAYTFPLFYADLAKKKFALTNNVFLNFSVKYEEAKYSKHVLGSSDLASALNDYNNFFEKLCKNERRSIALYRQCLALLHQRPIFVLSSSEVVHG
jgi:hypothetical protein